MQEIRERSELKAHTMHILNGTDGREYGYFDSDSSVERTVKACKEWKYGSVYD